MRQALGAERAGEDDVAALSELFPRVAIVHEWLTVPGGSEKVVLRLLELFPRAELFTSIYDPAPWPRAITSRPVHTSFLNRAPGAKRNHRRLLPLMNTAFESFDLDGFDLVISSSHSCAKNVITGPDTLHVCYCHTPMRHAWDPRFLDGERLDPFTRRALPLLLARLRREDLASSLRPDQYVANSTAVAARIAKYYRRDARIIHPPVQVDSLLTTPRAAADYYLVLGRIVPYKRVDVAVAACRRLGVPLTVAGAGRALESVRALAGEAKGIELLGEVDDAELSGLFAGARALLLPGEEDFGIVPVEAQAAGVPVIAYGAGGARDTVIDGETGILYRDPSVDGLCAAIRRFADHSFDEATVRNSARRFAPERFLREFAAFLTGPGTVRCSLS